MTPPAMGPESLLVWGGGGVAELEMVAVTPVDAKGVVGLAGGGAKDFVSETPDEDCVWLAVEVELVELADEEEEEDEVVDPGRRPPSRPPPSVELDAVVWGEAELVVEVDWVLVDGESIEVAGGVGGVVAGGGACRLAKRWCRGPRSSISKESRIEVEVRYEEEKFARSDVMCDSNGHYSRSNTTSSARASPAFSTVSAPFPTKYAPSPSRSVTASMPLATRTAAPSPGPSLYPLVITTCT